MNLNSEWALHRESVRQRVDFHPFLSPFITPRLHRWIQRLLKRDLSNPFLAKAEGMLHFHVEGKRPIVEQVWPECVASQKEVQFQICYPKQGGLDVKV